MNTQAIRELLSQGETGKALEALIALIEKDSRFKDSLLRTLRVKEANYNAVRQQELKGILPFQEAQREYSQVADTLLAVIDDFEAGRVPTTGIPGSTRRRNLIWLAGGAGLLLVAAVAFWVLGRNHSDPNCPKYETGGLKVLILPFEKLGEQPERPALLIRDDINKLAGKNNFPVEAQVYKSTADQTFNRSDATALAGKCGDADLVVWGQYKVFAADSIRVKVGFLFPGEGQSSGQTPFMTFRDVTDIKADKNLKDAVFSLCSMLAIRKENPELAKRWLAKMTEQDTLDHKMMEWLNRKER